MVTLTAVTASSSCPRTDRTAVPLSMSQSSTFPPSGENSNYSYKRFSKPRVSFCTTPQGWNSNWLRDDCTLFARWTDICIVCVILRGTSQHILSTEWWDLIMHNELFVLVLQLVPDLQTIYFHAKKCSLAATVFYPLMAQNRATLARWLHILCNIIFCLWTSENLGQNLKSCSLPVRLPPTVYGFRKSGSRVLKTGSMISIFNVLTVLSFWAARLVFIKEKSSLILKL